MDENAGGEAIEDLHYLLVNVEKMKRNMLVKMEG